MRVDFSELRAAIIAQPWRSIALAALAGACTALAGARDPFVRTMAADVRAAVFRSLLSAHVAPRPATTLAS